MGILTWAFQRARNAGALKIIDKLNEAKNLTAEERVLLTRAAQKQINPGIIRSLVEKNPVKSLAAAGTLTAGTALALDGKFNDFGATKAAAGAVGHGVEKLADKAGEAAVNYGEKKFREYFGLKSNPKDKKPEDPKDKKPEDDFLSGKLKKYLMPILGIIGLGAFWKFGDGLKSWAAGAVALALLVHTGLRITDEFNPPAKGNTNTLAAKAEHAKAPPSVGAPKHPKPEPALGG